MTDFAADNYYARHDGTEDTTPDADDLTPMTAALDRTEAALTAFATATDTDTALIRIAALARLAGIALRVYEHWSACSCTTGTHPYMKRSDAYDEGEARMWATSSREPRHVVRNHRLDGYTAWEVAP